MMMFPATIGSERIPFVVVLYLLSIAFPIHFYLGGIFMTVTRVLLLVVSVPIAIRLFGGKMGRILPADWLLLIFSVWNIFILFIDSPSQALSFGGSYALEVFGSYLLARNYIRTPEQFIAACRGLFALLIFTIPFALYENRTGIAPIPTFIAKLPGLASWGDYYNMLSGKRLGLERAQVVFSHPIHYGLFSSSLISFALIAFKNPKKVFRRYILAALVCVGVVASVSSGAILPMVLQIGLLVWALIFRRVKSRWLILCGIIAFCYVVVDMLSNRTPITVFLSYATLSPETAYGRIYIFEWGMDNVWKHPFLGIGLNEWERPYWKSSSMDNFWLLTAVRYGIPGFLMLGYAYAWLIWTAMRRDFGDGGPIWRLRRAWVFMQVGMILTLCTVDVWSTALSYIFFILGMGVWLILIQPDVAEEGAADQKSNMPARSGPRYTRFNGDRIRQGAGYAGAGQAK